MKTENLNGTVEEVVEVTMDTPVTESYDFDSPEKIYVEDHAGNEVVYEREGISGKKAAVGGAIGSLAAAAAGFAGGVYYERRKRNKEFKLILDIVLNQETADLNEVTIANIQKDIVSKIEDAKLSTKEAAKWNDLLNRFVEATVTISKANFEKAVIDEMNQQKEEDK